MGSRISHRAAAAALSLMTMGATALVMTAGATVAQAAVWTDQTDYPPGSVVTIHGDNSDGAGYQAGETVNVVVNQPNDITQTCDGTADDSGAWSCQITLGTGIAAVGSYSYTATGQTSGVSQNGTFTDANCPASNAIGNFPTDPNVTAAFTTSGGTATYSVTTPNETGGGLLDYCSYPTGGGSLPDTAQASIPNWTAGIDSSKGFVAFGRNTGNDNLPFDGTTQTVGTATWNSNTVPAQTILLHINDPNECTALGQNPPTCFVYPGSGAANKDLQVSKTATPSFTRTYTWGITKSVDPANQKISGGLALFHYTVSVTHDSGADGNWQVTGTITVHNPNSEAVTLTGVADATGGGGTCTVSGDTGQNILAHSDSTGLGYTCTYSSNPGKVTDTATATWDPTAASTPDGSASGSADADFSKVSPTLVDDSVKVTDSLKGSLGTVTAADPSPTTFTYDQSFPGVAGTCTSYPNTAQFKTNTSGTTGSASQSATVCVGEDLTVIKTAAPSFTRTYNWSIAKNVDKALFEQIGGTVTANYTVGVTEDGYTDSGWEVTGTITVHNPNQWEPVTLTGVTDATGGGGTCTVSGDTGQNILANSDSTGLGYTCTYSSNPGKVTDTATATWDPTAASTPDNSASGSADAVFGNPTTTVNKTITVTDSYAGTLGTATATDSSPFTSKTFTYSRTFTVPTNNCVTYKNTASIFETGQMDSASVEVCGPAKTGALTIGFWKTTNGQNLIKTYCTSGSGNLGTYLAGLGAGLGPFSNAPSDCSSLAKYVTNILAGASATNMNSMLKAQMLGTSLDVWFSGPGWTSTAKSGIKPPSNFLAHNSLSSFNMDTTAVCPMVDNLNTGTATCTNSTPSTDAVQAGAVPTSPMSMQAILDYAATTPSPFSVVTSGSVWYSGNKTKEEVLKNIFDQFNNQFAFGSF
jgi:hypothetical protein